MLVQRSFWVRRPNDFRYPVTAAPPACAFRSVSRYAGLLISWKHHSEYAIVPSANEVAAAAEGSQNTMSARLSRNALSFATGIDFAAMGWVTSAHSRSDANLLDLSLLLIKLLLLFFGT